MRSAARSEQSQAQAAAGPVPASHRVPAHLARRFHQICLGITAEVTEAAGLVPIELSVLAALAHQPELDQSSLARLIGVDAVTVHHLVQRLAAAGHVERRTDPSDRRARRLRLTPRGAALRASLLPALRKTSERILSPLSPAERPVFMDMLARIIAAHRSYARPGNGRRQAPREAAMEES